MSKGTTSYRIKDENALYFFTFSTVNHKVKEGLGFTNLSMSRMKCSLKIMLVPDFLSF